MRIDSGQTILFTGDSITDCGRSRPIGEGAGLGDGYVSLVDSILSAASPEREVKILNTGIGGNTVVDLEARWQSDVLDLRPDWLAVMIGINDVWRQFDTQFNHDQVTIDRYENTYRRILGQLRKNHPRLGGLVLMTPYFIEPDSSDPMRERMDKYGAVVQRLANEFDAIFVDIQEAFDRYLAHRSSQTLCEDRVHPNQSGHMIIARSFLSAIGFE